jgi:hypothetical protein
LSIHATVIARLAVSPQVPFSIKPGMKQAWAVTPVRLRQTIRNFQCRQGLGRRACYFAKLLRLFQVAFASCRPDKSKWHC